MPTFTVLFLSGAPNYRTLSLWNALVWHWQPIYNPTLWRFHFMPGSSLVIVWLSWFPNVRACVLFFLVSKYISIVRSIIHFDCPFHYPFGCPFHYPFHRLPYFVSGCCGFYRPAPFDYAPPIPMLDSCHMSSVTILVVS